MSDEESFVILGTSPLSSLETDGVDNGTQLHSSSLQSDTPGGHVSSLNKTQINDLQNAQEIATQTGEFNLAQTENSLREKVLIKSMAKSDLSASTGSELCDSQEIATQTPVHSHIQPEMGKIFIKSMEKSNISNISDSRFSFLKRSQICDPAKEISVTEQDLENSQQQMADSKLWSRKPQVQIQENMMPLSLEDCALKSPVEQKEQQKSEESVRKSVTNSSSEKTVPENLLLNKSKITPTSVESNLAASFLLGEVNADVLKTSVYSQFPSISMEACAEDVLKLQNMVIEHSQLKTTIKKANNTMKLFYNNSVQWKDKMKAMEDEYRQKLDNCNREIEVLRKQNQDLDSNFMAQIEALEIARKKDREETIQEISEKNALLENLRAQIVKLEQQQLASFEFVSQTFGEQNNEGEFTQFYISRPEHERKVKQLERELSELLARNLDFKDVEKQYIDELNCLKVNLTAAEELIKKHHAEISQLQMADVAKQEQIKELENSLSALQRANEEQIERIALLEQQNEVHRNDFEMEHESRQTAVKEKTQILQDLRTLQRKNQELIQEHQKLAQSYERKLSSSGAWNVTQMTAAAASAHSYIDNPQRPIRTLPSSSSVAPSTATSFPLHQCPICNKAFKSLIILQSHVNDCMDKH